MPRIQWPKQPAAILDASGEHAVPLPERVRSLLTAAQPPAMTADVARTFLRCFYAARDLQRSARDLAGGGGDTDAFRAAALARRVEEFSRRVRELEAVLGVGEGRWR